MRTIHVDLPDDYLQRVRDLVLTEWADYADYADDADDADDADWPDLVTAALAFADRHRRVVRLDQELAMARADRLDAIDACRRLGIAWQALARLTGQDTRSAGFAMRMHDAVATAARFGDDDSPRELVGPGPGVRTRRLSKRVEV